ncbi:MAG: ATP-binding cassette domain-containing protein [Bifidobacteriaceae bacterium]|jgi:putative ABC transport system ATP-binding protein|nr:ATP-binding cassette domain-containing protein [Bifidobacteriaceae bacterium]
MNATVLAGIGLTYAYGENQVLHGVDLAIGRGEVVAVMGPSGSGKSTLLHVLAGLLEPAAGEVYLDGERLDALPERLRAARRLTKIGFVFQFGDLLPELTVGENVGLPLALTGAPPAAVRARARQLMERLGIGALAGRRLGQVSGGQAQRAAVARALIHRPPLVMADEPTGALDSAGGELVLDALLGAAREQGTAVLLVTHELKVAGRAERDILLRDGRVVGASSPPAEGRRAMPRGR